MSFTLFFHVYTVPQMSFIEKKLNMPIIGLFGCDNFFLFLEQAVIELQLDCIISLGV